MCTYLTVGELAQHCGTTVSALHFYERQRLITPTRSVGNQRRYSPWAVHRVWVILTARAAGESVEAIRGLLQPLPTDRPPTQPEWARIVAELLYTDRAAQLQPFLGCPLREGRCQEDHGARRAAPAQRCWST